MTKHEPAIDIARISFPSDRLTVKAIRVAEPNLFDHPDVWVRSAAGDDSNFLLMLRDERAIAYKAFAKTLGLPARVSSSHRNDIVHSLAEEYSRLGLSTGPKHTVQLIRDIEAQAIAQAKEHLGKGR